MQLKTIINDHLRPIVPLLVMFCVVLLWATALTHPWSGSHSSRDWMQQVMGGFFLLFGGLKASSLRSFVPLFRGYDIVAKRVPFYAYSYPFVEIALGVAYTFSLFQLVTNSLTVIILSVGTIGIIQKLLTRPKFTCACLGGLFNIPLTWLTAVENMVMVAMAIHMIFYPKH